MKLIHITDPHLRADPGARLHGWDVQRAFDCVLDHALAAHPDYDALVLGGDLVDDESAAGYARLNDRLAPLTRPILAMAGNHDEPALLARMLTNASVHRPIAVAGHRLHALDSHQRNSDAGRIAPGALTTLERELAAECMPTLVFVHHPPVDTGSAWIDAIGLENADALIACLDAHRHVRAIVSGHIHQALETRKGSIDCWSTPSTMRQFLPESAAFAEDPRRAPGYRLIETNDTGTLTTTVVRVPAAALACG